MMPNEVPPDDVSPVAPPPAVSQIPQAAPAGDALPAYRWYHKAGAVLFITFCLDIGLFLLIFPWTDSWEDFAAFARSWRPYLDNMYMRGALSGVGS